MALDTTTFLIVFAAAIALMGLFAWLRFRYEKETVVMSRGPKGEKRPADVITNLAIWLILQGIMA